MKHSSTKSNDSFEDRNKDIKILAIYMFLKSWGSDGAIKNAYERKGGKSNTENSVRQSQIDLLQSVIQYFLKNPGRHTLDDGVSTVLGTLNKVEKHLKKGKKKSKLLDVINEIKKPLKNFSEGYGITAKPEDETLLFLDEHSLMPDMDGPLKTYAQDLHEIKKVSAPSRMAEGIIFFKHLDVWSKENYIADAYKQKGGKINNLKNMQKTRMFFLQTVISFLNSQECNLSLADRVSYFVGTLALLEKQLQRDKDPIFLQVVNEFQSSLKIFVEGNLSGIETKSQEEVQNFLESNLLMPKQLKAFYRVDEIKENPPPDSALEDAFFSIHLKHWSKRNYIADAYKQKGGKINKLENLQKTRIFFLQTVINYLDSKECNLNLADRVGYLVGTLELLEEQLKRDKDPIFLQVVNEFQSPLKGLVERNVSGIETKSQEEVQDFLESNLLMPKQLKAFDRTDENKKNLPPDSALEDAFFSIHLKHWSKRNYILNAYQHKGGKIDKIEMAQKSRIDFLQSVLNLLSSKEEALSLADRVGYLTGALAMLKDQLHEDKETILLQVVNEFQSSLQNMVNGSSSDIRVKSLEEVKQFLAKNDLMFDINTRPDNFEQLSKPKVRQNIFSNFKQKEASNQSEHTFVVNPLDNRAGSDPLFHSMDYMIFSKDDFFKKWVIDDNDKNEISLKNQSENKKILIKPTVDDGLCFVSPPNSVDDMLHAARVYLDSKEESEYEYSLSCNTEEQAEHMLSELKVNNFDLRQVTGLKINDQELSQVQIDKFIQRLFDNDKPEASTLKY